MALMIATVTPDDGDQLEVEVSSRDLARWESLGGGRSVRMMQDAPSMTELIRIVWCAMERLSNAGRLQLPPGVTDWQKLRDLCEVTVVPADGLDAMAGALGGGAYPPGA